LKCKFEGSFLAFKPALSQMVRDRICAFNTAFDLIRNSSLSEGKEVDRRKDKNRVITVGGVVAFDQTASGGLGSFVGAYTGLSLPGKS